MQAINRQDFHNWFADRAKLGYSFESVKGPVPGDTYSDGTPCPSRNIAWICTQTNERFDFIFA